MLRRRIAAMNIRPGDDRRGNLHRHGDKGLRRYRNREAAMAVMICADAFSCSVCIAGIGYRDDRPRSGTDRHIFLTKKMQAAYQHIDDRQHNRRQIAQTVRAAYR